MSDAPKKRKVAKKPIIGLLKKSGKGYQIIEAKDDILKEEKALSPGLIVLKKGSKLVKAKDGTSKRKAAVFAYQVKGWSDSRKVHDLKRIPLRLVVTTSGSLLSPKDYVAQHGVPDKQPIMALSLPRDPSNLSALAMYHGGLFQTQLGRVVLFNLESHAASDMKRAENRKKPAKKPTAPKEQKNLGQQTRIKNPDAFRKKAVAANVAKKKKKGIKIVKGEKSKRQMLKDKMNALKKNKA